MNIKYLLNLIFLLLLTGCYPSISGTVVDAETGKAIEGAVVMAEWTKTKGIPGMPYTKSYKVSEAVTDKEGKFRVSGVYNPFVNPPDVTVYKIGYVAWNNHDIFPDYEKRKDFKWRSGYIFKLERFKEEYSYDKHVDFIRGCINSSLNLEAKKKIFDAFEWDRDLAFQERMKKHSQKQLND